MRDFVSFVRLLPSLPAAVWFVLLLALALIAGGGFLIWKRRIGMGIMLVAAGAATGVFIARAASPTATETPQDRIAVRSGKEPVEVVLGLGLAIVGTLVAGAAARWLRDLWQFRWSAVRTRGRIVKVTPATGVSSENSWEATVSFRTEKGKEHSFETQYWGDPNRASGREVTVLYAAQDPAKAQLRSLSVWLVPLMVGAGGLVVLAIGLGFIFVKPE
jgi:Protein of unknown function (DUF3592)